MPTCNCTILQIDELIQKNVTTVVTSNPQLIDFKQLKSSGDAFLIATAMKYSLTVITEENKDSSKKIPYVASFTIPVTLFCSCCIPCTISVERMIFFSSTEYFITKVKVDWTDLKNNHDTLAGKTKLF